MSDVKKSDVFGPKQSPSFVISMTTEQCRYCYNAFNDYDSNRELITELEKLTDGQHAMINFQSAQHNVIVDLGIKREKEIINLKRQIAGLKDKVTIERDPRTPMVIIPEQLG